jgi:protein tyrosine/serine phosphatase
MLRKRTLIFAASLMVLAACSAPPTDPASNPDFAKLLPDAGGLSHVARITEDLYRGAQPTDLGYDTLRKMGIKTVISFRRFNTSRKVAEAAGLNYVAIPIYASVGSSPPSDAQVKRFFDTVYDPAKQPVFFHCQHGKDRTGMMAALFRIEREGWSNTKAIEEMQTFGYHDVFRDLIGYVRKYKPRGLHRQH